MQKQNIIYRRKNIIENNRPLQKQEQEILFFEERKNRTHELDIKEISLSYNYKHN